MRFVDSGKKIAFICSPNLTTFIAPICDHLLRNTELRIRRVFSVDSDVVTTAIKWADVIWFEWANELTIAVTKKAEGLLRDKRVIVRCHSYEALVGLYTGLNWPVVDVVVFVSNHIQALCSSMLSVRETVVVPNGLNTCKFQLSTEKNPGTIAHVGNINHKKGPMLLLHAFHHLLSVGEDVELHWAGAVQELRFDYYIQHMLIRLGLSDKVKMYGKVEDIAEFLKDKECVICTSPWESQNLSLMEGMLCGCKPLIHNFPGAEEVYDKKWVWNTFDELHALFSAEYTPEAYREYIVERYDFDKVIEQVLEVLGDG